DERPILDLNVAGDQRATANHRIVSHFRVVGDVSRGHDVVAVADFGNRLRLGAARDGVVLAYAVPVADLEIAALAGEGFVERIGSEDGTGRNLVALSHRSPALHVD